MNHLTQTHFSGIKNFRDFHSIFSTIKPLRLMRSATPSEATEEDVIMLTKSNLQTIIDFRDEREAKKDAGSRRLLVHFKEHDNTGTPSSSKSDKTLIRSPFVETHKMARTLLSRMSWIEVLDVFIKYTGGLVFHNSSVAKKNAQSSIISKMNGVGLHGLYEFILKNSGNQIRATLQVCCDRSRHPILLHCSHGKDRTGVITALILGLLDAPRELILRDYNLSELHGLSPTGQAHFVQVPEMDPVLWGSAPKWAMQATLDFLERDYGSIPNYLCSIGFDLNAQALLVKALTD